MVRVSRKRKSPLLISLFYFIVHIPSYFVPTFPVWYGILTFKKVSIRCQSVTLITDGAHATFHFSKPFPKPIILHKLGPICFLHALLWTGPCSSCAEINSSFYFFTLSPLVGLMDLFLILFSYSLCSLYVISLPY